MLKIFDSLSKWQNFAKSGHTAPSLVLTYFPSEIGRYPGNAVVYEIGRSVQKRKIIGIRIGTTNERRELLKPMVKIVANMHGNEV